MTLYHSCSEKPEVGNHMLFDRFVFFTGYHQQTRGSMVFKLEDTDQFDIIDVSTIFDDSDDFTDEQAEAIDKLIQRAKKIVKRETGYTVSDATAKGLIDQSISIEDHEELIIDIFKIDEDEFEDRMSYLTEIQYRSDTFDVDWSPEAAWQLQMLGCQAARALGFDGVELQDEMGNSTAIWLEGKDDLLIECTDDE
ncbi:hypothetical protein GCM10007989_13430 [Devosia pacifica]|uniref:Uncharacterized protein n=1 Tax=Devosia pacifica TaxID=1335967 RepID=A0A918VSN1_9HYPH|nr:hypothetical protein [Devosia pacifica]GHA19249.1 hypothetical protein GCM10007989_13430 [Devosia pacifica]